MECSADSCDCSQYPMFRPRGALARALYNKQLADERLASLDYSQWYRVNKRSLQPSARGTFHQCSLDPETEEFIANSTELSDNVLLQVFHSLVKIFLGFFMSQTSINGMLGRGSMFVVSGGQLEELTGLKKGGEGSLLDVGAGDGAVTHVMAPYFNKVHVTELSKPMRSQLAARGYRVIEEGEVGESRYDVVSCLNVLDRCEKPLTMVADLRRALRPGGLAILAMVLPFRPYVEFGKKDHRPLETLPILGSTFEEQVNSVIDNFLVPAGFKVERWTRLPYLCQGDLSQSFYWLDDALFFLSVDHHSEHTPSRS